MRVLQVTASMERRGAEVFADQLQTSLRRRRHHVTTVAFSDPSRSTSLQFTPLGPRRFGLRELLRLARLLRSHDVCIVHGGVGLVPVTLVAALVRRPFVYRNIGDPSHWGAVRFAQLRIGRPLRRAAVVVGLYESASAYMISEYGLKREKVMVVSNAVVAKSFLRRTDEERRARRSEVVAEGSGPVLGYLGALSSEKRPEWAVDVAAAIDPAVLLVAGDGPLRQEVERHARRDAPGRVHFLGSIDDPSAFLSAIDVLLLPSRTEGIPGVLIEAALVGTPVVATRVGGVGDVVDSLGCGIAVGVADLEGFVDAVRVALKDPLDLLARRDVVVREHDVDRVVSSWELALARATQ